MHALAESVVVRGDPTRSPRKGRAHLRTHLRDRIPRVRHLAVLAEQAIEGPDPEAAMVYLRMLRRRIDEVLSR